MASIIIADENEGRRNLLANTFEREGYEGDPIEHACSNHGDSERRYRTCSC